MGPSGYCHRKPNGVWIHLLPRFFAIRSATNDLPSVSAQICALRVPLRSAATMLSAPSKPHRLEIWFPLTKILPPLLSKLFSASYTNHWLRDSQVQGSSEPASLTISRTLFLFPVPFSLFPSLRSSPRPISIIKLHTLPHFHR